MQASPHPQTGRSAVARLRPLSAWVYIGVFVLLAALVLGLAAFTLMQERARYRERAVVATQNIAKLLEQHTSDTFEQVDLMVQSAAWFAQEQFTRGTPDAAALNRYLAHQESLLPELRGFRMTDAKGVVRYGLGGQAQGAVISVADEAFFNAALQSDSTRALVMGPVYAPIAKRWVIVFARRVVKADGAVVGVVYANFPTDTFEQVFSSVQLGPQGAATIRGTDMALVHRVPTTKNAVGSRNVSKELSQIIEQNPVGGVYVAATALDGIERSNAYRRLTQYPFYVIVGQATSDYLRGWMSSLVLVSGLSLFALLATGLAAWSAWRAQLRLLADLHEKTRLATELEQSDSQRKLLNAELEIKVRQAQAATVARDAFLAHVSHEMRTPLHQISGLASLLGRQPLSDKQQAWLHTLDASAARMTAMVDQVLAFVRLESEQASFSSTPLLADHLLEQAAGRWRERVSAKGLELTLRCEVLEGALLGDAGQLGAALDSLLQNALDHTQQGGIGLSCTLVARESEHLTLRFSVADSGTGMSDELMARLFDVFEQADSSSTTWQAGMGLSLAIVRKMARLMGGDAGAASKPGQGSNVWFTVRLPRAGV